MKDSIKESLDRYAESGTPTGGFLRAVLEDKLMEAVTMADDENVRDIVEICRYVYNSLPYSCHGNPERVRAWMGHKGMEKFQVTMEQLLTGGKEA